MSPMNPREIRSFLEGVWRRTFGDYPVVKQRDFPEDGQRCWCLDGWLFLVPTAAGGWDLAVHLANPLALGDRPCLRSLHGSREHYGSLWEALIAAAVTHSHRKAHDAIDAWAKEHHHETVTTHRPYNQPRPSESN